jgi:hypothetical protein
MEVSGEAYSSGTFAGIAVRSLGRVLTASSQVMLG